MAPAINWNELMKTSEEPTSGGFAPLEEGKYNFVIQAEPKVGKTNKGLPKYSINPSVEDGPRKNARVFHHFNVSESGKAMGFFFRDMAALGLTADFWNTNPSDEQIVKALHGRRFSADVVHAKSEDGKKTYENLKNLLPAVGNAALPGVPSAGVPAVAAAPAAGNWGAPISQAAPAAPVQAAAPVAQAAPAPAPAQTVASDPWGAPAAPAPAQTAASDPWGAPAAPVAEAAAPAGPPAPWGNGAPVAPPLS